MPEKFDSSYAHEGGFRIGRYRYGDRKWEDYLIDNRRASEESARYTHDTIRNVAGEVSEGVSGSFEKLHARIVSDVGRAMQDQGVAFSTDLGDLVQRQSEAMERQNERLMESVGDLGAGLARGLDGLATALGMGFELLGSKLDQQMELNRRIASHLDEIHRTLLSPSDTQAREFHRKGESHVKHGLYSEAMDILNRSEKIETVNPPLHVLKGLIYFAQPEFLDLTAAKHEFEAAIRYVEAIKTDLSHELWWRVRDQGYLGLAKIAFAQSGDAALAGDVASASALLKDVIRLASKSPCSFETRYLRAVACSVDGQTNEAIKIIEDLADEIPRFLVDALSDPHFASLREQLAEIPQRLHSNPESATFKLVRQLVSRL
jgi:tetratricopeptide (TPR) repeat protein